VTTTSLVVCLGLVLFAPMAEATEFEKPTAASLTKLLIRFGAINPREDDVLNDYAMVSECKLFDYFYHDDFKWHDVQAALRKSIRENVNVFPTGFAYDGAMKLSRYDFRTGLFRFDQETPRTMANTFTVVVPGDQMYCKGMRIKWLPIVYRFVLDQPVRFDGIPLTESDAERLVKRMEESRNKERIIFVRFNIRVVYVTPLSRKKESTGQYSGRFSQGENQSTIRLDSRLDSIEYYEDEAKTRLIYEYRPQ
jgi:hypothetical protein